MEDLIKEVNRQCVKLEDGDIDVETLRTRLITKIEDIMADL